MDARRGGGRLSGLAAAVILQLCLGPGHAADAGRQQARVPCRVVVRLSASLPDEARRSLLASAGLTPIASINSLGVEVAAPAGSRDMPALLSDLRRLPDVLWAEPDSWCRVALAAPDDPAYHDCIGDLPLQWPLHVLDALTAWDCYPSYYFDAAGRPQDTPIVAVIDTGIDSGHPDFMNTGAEGPDVTEGGQLLLAAARSFLSDSPSAPPSDVTDEHGHGTHLAGIVAAAANNGMTGGSGVAGLGYPARLLVIKVAGASGAATHADIASAVVYAADQGASVILIGFAGPTWSRTLQDAVDYAWQKGCFLAAPAGDVGAGFPSFPAGCPHVFGVAATTTSGATAWYSAVGEQVDLAAPGGDEVVGVYSALPTYACTLRTNLATPPYDWLFGTSQAAAHVAGAAALYAGNGGAGAEATDRGRVVWQALQRSAIPCIGVATEGWDASCGYGVVSPTRLVLRQADASKKGGLVGRALISGEPAVGASVTVIGETGEVAAAGDTQWPAGAYRIPDVPTGTYCVRAELAGKLSVWEGIRVLSGCDVPAVDFRLGGPSPGAALVSAEIPRAAVRGEQTEVTFTFKNTGASTWTRADGYCVRQIDSERPMSSEPVEVWLAPGESVAPGKARTFSVLLSAPDAYGFYDTGWQMCEQGGVGRFGEVASGTVSVTSFLDVPADYWAVDSIEAAKAAEIVMGYKGHLYRPEWSVPRDQMAVFLGRAVAGGDDQVPPGPEVPTFTDVDREQWAYRHIEYAWDEGVVRGYRDHTYRPARIVDRAQMAVFIARGIAGGESGLDDYVAPTEPSFSDVATDYWAYRHIEYLKGEGVVHGYRDGTYRPKQACRRDQMAVFLAQAWDLP
jgi:thermitase